MKTLALAILTACGAVDAPQTLTPAETVARQAMIAALNAAMIKACRSLPPVGTNPGIIHTAWLIACARFQGAR